LITGIQAGQLSFYWPLVEPWLKKACDYSIDGTTVEDLKLWIGKEEAQLWIAVDNGIQAALVTRIVCYPRYKSLCVVSAGGRHLKKWIQEAQDLFTAFGRYCNCDRIEIHGRPGWSRIFRNARVAAITITKDLK